VAVDQPCRNAQEKPGNGQNIGVDPRSSKQIGDRANNLEVSLAVSLADELEWSHWAILLTR
jgi:hypothetical protein